MQEFIITVAVCTSDRVEYLSQVLTSLEHQSLATDQYKVLVIDNSVTDETYNYFHKSAYNLNIEYIRENGLGLSNARNTAINRCQSTYIAFIDDDAIADIDWLKEICGQFELCGSDTGVIGGETIPIWPETPPPWLHESLKGYLSINKSYAETIELTDSEWLAGTNIAFKTAAIKEAGFFRTDLGRIGLLKLGNEEVELTNRIRSLDWKVIYSPLIKVSHHIHPERISQKWVLQRVMWQAISDMIMRNEDYDNSIGLAQISSYLEAADTSIKSIEKLFQFNGDPEDFRQQCNAVHGLTCLLYKGGLSA